MLTQNTLSPCWLLSETRLCESACASFGPHLAFPVAEWKLLQAQILTSNRLKSHTFMTELPTLTNETEQDDMLYNWRKAAPDSPLSTTVGGFRFTVDGVGAFNAYGCLCGVRLQEGLNTLIHSVGSDFLLDRWFI